MQVQPDRGYMRLLYKAPTDNTKPRHIRQSPNRQHNPPKDNTKPRSLTISNAILNIIQLQYYY